MKKVLIATEKPFATAARDAMVEIFKENELDVQVLEKYEDKSQLIAALTDASALIVRSDKIDRELIEAAPELKVIVRAGAGVDSIDCAAATEHNICVMNTPGQNANAVAELVFGLLVYMFRNRYNGSAGHELKDRKLGILAFGNVGKNVARVAKGFGMKVYAYDGYVSEDMIRKEGVEPVKSAEELFSTCEVVSIHIPKTKETVKSMNYELLSKMPKGGCLINTARQEVIDEEEIAKLMRDREDFLYITDIKPNNHDEMMAFGDRYYATPKKMGAQTAEANRNAGLAAARQVVDFLKTGAAPYRVNK